MSIFQLSTLAGNVNSPTSLTISDTLFGEIQLPSNTYPPINPSTYTAFSIFGLTTLANKLITGYTSTIQRNQGSRVNTSSSDRLLDFGILTSDSEIVLSLTNFSVEDVQISEINFLAEAGIVVSGISIDQVIPSNTTVVFTIIAYSDIGLSAINSLVEVLFTNGISILYNLEIIRTSSFVYSFEPSAASYSEKISYKTEIVTFTNGREARRALLTNPKRSVNYSTTAISAAELDYGSNIINFGYANKLHQPLWSQHDTINTSLNGFRILVNTIGKDYKVGGYAAFLTDPMYPILLQVISVGDTYVDVASSLTLPAPFIIAPTFIVYPSVSSTYSVENLRFGQFKFSLEEI